MASNGSNNGANGDNSPLPHKGNQVIHIRGDSDSELQALFDSVLQPNNPRRQKMVPFRLRKLPDSFFNPPSTGSKSPSVSVSHSRENSVDSTLNSMRYENEPSFLSALYCSSSAMQSILLQMQNYLILINLQI